MGANGTSIRRREFAAVLFTLLGAACTPRPDPAPSWTFQPEGLRIRYRADPMLNSRDGAAHTLVAAVYQLSTREAFDALAASEDGLRTLLEVKRFDPAVAGQHRIIVQPGAENEIVLDRAEGARWVGIVLGYYSLDPERAVRVFEIGHTVETTGRFRRVKSARVQPLTIDLTLGPGAVNTIGALR